MTSRCSIVRATSPTTRRQCDAVRSWFRRRRSVASVTALALLAAVPVGIAVLHQGFPVTDVDLDARTVWVTNGEGLSAGRLSRPIAELDGAVNTASREVDVFQHGNDVFLHDESSGTIERIDPSFTTLIERTDVPIDAVVAYGGDFLAIMEPESGDVWVVDAAGGLAFDAGSTEPVISLGPGGQVAVSAEGTVFATSPDARALFRIDRGSAEASRSELPELGAHELAAVGERPVVLDLERNRLISGSERIELPAPALKLQQSGGDNDVALVATGEGLLEVPLSGGEVRRIDAEISGELTDPDDVSSPVWLDGCAHGAWAGAQRYLAACEGEAARAEDLREPTHGSLLEFRVNRSVIVLNDLTNGNTWLLDSDMRLVDNWDEATPPEEEEAEEGDEKSSTQSFEDTLAERTEENRPPSARDDIFGVRPGVTTVIPVLDNDTDPDGDVLTIASTTEVSGSRGRLELIDGGRALQFTPTDSMQGSVSFRYTATDGRPGGVAEAQADITVRPEESNTAPVSQRSAATSVEQGQLISYNVLRDWSDPDGDGLYLVSATPKSGDAVRFAPDGAVTFEHTSAELGQKEIAFVVSDGVETASGILTVDVKPTGQLNPVGTPDFAETFIGETVLVEPLANDLSPSGAPLALVGVKEAPADAEVTPNLERGTIAFTAARAGSYTVLYSLGAGASSSVGLIRVDVKESPAEPLAPIAVTDLAYLRAGEPLSIAVLGNDVSAGGDVLAVQSVDSDPVEGLLTVEVLANAVVRITPSSALTEQLQFDYTVSDGRSTATAGITVIPVPPLVKHQPPVAVDDAARVRTGDIVTVPVLDNDHHPDSAPLSVEPELVDASGAGEGLAFVSGNAVRYQAPLEPGVYTVDYRLTDPHRETAVATVRFAVVGPGGENTAPQPLPLTTRTFADSTVKIDVPLDGLDADGDSVALRGITTSPRLGRVVSTDSGTLEYQSYPGMAGTDSFDYEVEDTMGARATGTIRVGVIPRPETDSPPNAVDDAIEILPGRVASVPVWRNDSDPNGYPLEVSEDLLDVDDGIEASVDDGRVVVEAPDTEGAFTIRYEITNGHGGVDSAFLQVLVTEDARPVYPTSVDQLVSPEEVVDATSVDVDVLEGAENPGGRLSDLVVSLEGPNADAAEVLPDGEVRVRPTGDRVAIAYRLTNEIDGLGTTSFIVVPPSSRGAVEERPAPPYLNDLPPQQTRLDTPIEWTVDDIVTVPSGRPALVLSASATNGDGSPVRIDGTTLRFTPAAGYRGPASVSFLVTDGTSQTDADGATALLTIPISVGDPDLEDVAPGFTSQTVTIEAGEAPFAIDLRDSASHPNPRLIDEIGFTNLSGMTAEVTAGLDGSELTATAPRGVQPGTRATLSFDVTLNEFTVPGTITVVVVSSTRPLPRTVDDPNAAENATFRPAQTVVLDVLENDFNPFAAEGEPLRVVGAVLDQSGAGATAAISFSGDTVTIRTGPSATGTLSAVYTVQDATGDRSRRVQGRITLSIVNIPDRPRAPEAVEGDGSATVTVYSTASNNSPIIDYTISWPGGQMTVPSEGTYSVTGLQNGVDYAFRVTARNSVGTSTASAESASVRPYGVPGAPASVNLSATTNGTGDMTLSWSPPRSDGGRGVTEYHWREVGAGAFNTTSATAVNFRMTVGTEYRFEVQACNPRGCGGWAQSNPATPSAPPPWTPTHYPTTITQTTCPEPDSAYPNGPWNRDSGCTMHPSGALQPGTVIDAICRSQRHGESWFYIATASGAYNGWFVLAAHTNRSGTSIPNC